MKKHYYKRGSRFALTCRYKVGGEYVPLTSSHSFAAHIASKVDDRVIAELVGERDADQVENPGRFFLTLESQEVTKLWPIETLVCDILIFDNPDDAPIATDTFEIEIQKNITKV